MGAETGITIGMSLISGLCLFTTTVAMGYISQQFDLSFTLLVWIAMPVLGYLIATAINTLTQQVSCSKIDIKKVFMSSLYNPIFIVAFLVFSWFSGLRSPIEGILTFIQDPFVKTTVAYGYYMFWAGLFGEAIGSGIAQGCGS